MFQVRIHGRGGQGVVTAAELLSVAAFLEGKHAQAFPSFGSERTGSPVVSFCRIDDKEIRLLRRCSRQSTSPCNLRFAGRFSEIAGRANPIGCQVF